MSKRQITRWIGGHCESAYSKIILSRLVLQFINPPIFSRNVELIGHRDVCRCRVNESLPEISIENDCVVSNTSNAVYSMKGQAIESSLLVRGQLGRKINARAHNDLCLEGKPKVINKAIYGGVLFANHHGHLITESTARLWPMMVHHSTFEIPDIPILFRIAGRGKLPTKKLAGNAKHLLEVIGIWERVHIVEEPTLVKELIIPHAANSNAQGVHLIFGELLKWVGKQLLQQCEIKSTYWHQKRVYLSRSNLSSKLRKLGNEKKLERILKENGFNIVHPQELSLKEQVNMFSQAREIVGPLGSAFHTMLFSQNNKMNLKYLVHDSPLLKFSSSRTYQIFDELCNADSAYIGCLDRHPLGLTKSQQFVIDLDRAARGILG